MTNNYKPWFKSWTIWFNIVLLLVSLITGLADIIPLPAQFVAIIVLVGNLALRFKTTTGIYLD